MKFIITILLFVSIVFGGLDTQTFLVDSYESADLQNYTGSFITDSTDITQITISDQYISLKSYTNTSGKMYNITNSEMINVSNGLYFTMTSVENDSIIIIIYHFQQKVIILHEDTNIVEVFNLESSIY